LRIELFLKLYFSVELISQKNKTRLIKINQVIFYHQNTESVKIKINNQLIYQPIYRPKATIVWEPTYPVTGKPLALWKDFTAFLVIGPK